MKYENYQKCLNSTSSRREKESQNSKFIWALIMDEDMKRKSLNFSGEDPRYHFEKINYIKTTTKNWLWITILNYHHTWRGRLKCSIKTPCKEFPPTLNFPFLLEMWLQKEEFLHVPHDRNFIKKRSLEKIMYFLKYIFSPSILYWSFSKNFPKVYNLNFTQILDFSLSLISGRKLEYL